MTEQYTEPSDFTELNLRVISDFLFQDSRKAWENNTAYDLEDNPFGCFRVGAVEFEVHGYIDNGVDYSDPDERELAEAGEGYGEYTHGILIYPKGGFGESYEITADEYTDRWNRKSLREMLYEGALQVAKENNLMDKLQDKYASYFRDELGLLKEGIEPYLYFQPDPRLGDEFPQISACYVSRADDLIHTFQHIVGPEPMKLSHPDGQHVLHVDFYDDSQRILLNHFTVIPATWLKEAREENPKLSEGMDKAMGSNQAVFDTYMKYVSHGIDGNVVRAVTAEKFSDAWEDMTRKEKEIFTSNLVHHTAEEFAHWANKDFREGSSSYFAWPITCEYLTKDLRRGLPPTPEIKALTQMIDNMPEREADHLIYRLMSPEKERAEALGEIRAFAKKQAKEK